MDNINKPKHYNSSIIEVITIIESITQQARSGYEGHLLGTIVKYLGRYRYKNGIEDLQKANWYLDKLINLMSEEVRNENKKDQEAAI